MPAPGYRGQSISSLCASDAHCDFLLLPSVRAGLKLAETQHLRRKQPKVNFIANRCFAYLFSYLVNVRLTDTLCGTKVLLRKDYETLARERGYFGNFDPFGDFDLIFGAAKQNLKIIETPIQYRARTFGETQISRFRDGWLLLKMVWFAYRKLKAI
jgi:hypothetical protein